MDDLIKKKREQMALKIRQGRHVLFKDMKLLPVGFYTYFDFQAMEWVYLVELQDHTGSNISASLNCFTDDMERLDDTVYKPRTCQLCGKPFIGCENQHCKDWRARMSVHISRTEFGDYKAVIINEDGIEETFHCENIEELCDLLSSKNV